MSTSGREPHSPRFPKGSPQWRAHLIETAARKEERRQKREMETEERRLLEEARARGLSPIDHARFCTYRGETWIALPTLGNRYYIDYPFTCRDCGREEVLTGAQQKWWLEEKGGSIETIPIRCRECRAKERTRKNEARRVAEEGKKRKAEKKARGA